MTESLSTGTETNTKTGLTGSTIKIIALTIMFIDHIAAIILTDYIQQKLALCNQDFNLVAKDPVYLIMICMRMIGRLAFPMFCFLLIEGFLHTKNKMKYAVRLLLFAIVSEIPFDYAVNHTFLEFGYQNVFFTLFLGLAAMTVHEKIAERYQERPWIFSCLQILLLIGFIFAAAGLRADYGMIGFITIYLMYCFRASRKKQILIGCLALTPVSGSEIFAFACYPILKRYNGERGRKMKYFFYVFYPVHIFLLAVISQLLGFR